MRGHEVHIHPLEHLVHAVVLTGGAYGAAHAVYASRDGILLRMHADGQLCIYITWAGAWTSACSGHIKGADTHAVYAYGLADGGHIHQYMHLGTRDTSRD